MFKFLSRLSLASLLLVFSVVLPAFASPIAVTFFKSPQCTCCDAYAAYLEKNGFKVDVTSTNDLSIINQKAGVPEALEGCHAMFVDGYVIQGHVPVDIIRKLLKERPKIIGISLPGMPSGVPGMEGARSEPLSIYEIASDDAVPKVFATIP